jgi:ribosomal protein S24E
VFQKDHALLDSFFNKTFVLNVTRNVLLVREKIQMTAYHANKIPLKKSYIKILATKNVPRALIKIKINAKVN